MAKQKLEHLFSDESKKDHLSLLTKPKQKLNLLSRLPLKNADKLSSAEQVYFSKREVTFNTTVTAQLKTHKLATKKSSRTMKSQAQKQRERTDTRGRTRAEIVAEFFCSQNWTYLAQKAMMVHKERRRFREAIAKYRRVKRGFKKLAQVYRQWIARVKLQRQAKQAEEELNRQEQLRVQQIVEEQAVKAVEVQPTDQITKCEFMLNEDDDIFSLNEGVDLTIFKYSHKSNSDDYQNKIQEIRKEKKKCIIKSKANKLESIPEEDEENVVLSQFQKRAGKVLALKLTSAWVQRNERREGRKLRSLLKNLPPQ